MNGIGALIEDPREPLVPFLLSEDTTRSRSLQSREGLTMIQPGCTLTSGTPPPELFKATRPVAMCCGGPNGL